VPAAESRATTLREQLEGAARRIGDRREAGVLAALALHQPLSWVYAHGDEPLDESVLARYADLIERRAQGVPFAYLAGRRAFYGREFSVSPDTLIPRPETEHLVEWALALDLPRDARVADIGTGSGCIALTLALERPDWSLTGTDVSQPALGIAEVNRTRLGAVGVRLLRGDLFEPLEQASFDLIVSNPPYVAEGDPHLSQDDVAHEPGIALIAGAGGLDIIRRLVKESREALTPGGWLLLEHGHDQAHSVRELLRQYGYREIESRPDLAGIERVTGGTSPAF